MKETGLLSNKETSIKPSIETSAIDSLVRWYCRESGVRNLENHIAKICRKLAFFVVAEDENLQLTEKQVSERKMKRLQPPPHPLTAKLTRNAGAEEEARGVGRHG